MSDGFSAPNIIIRGWTHLDLLQYRGVSAMSRLIRCFNWGDYSHTALRDPDDGGAVWESWPKGGCSKSESISTNHTPGTVVDVFQVPVMFDQRRAWIAFHERTLGARYDWRGIAGFVTRREWQRSDRYFCSEWVFAGNLASIEACPQGVALLAPWTPPCRVFPSMLAYSPVIYKAGAEVTA